MNGLNLNQFLMPADSPIVKNQGQVSAYRFDYENEAHIISSAQIRNAAIGSAQIGTAAIDSANINNFSFNSGTGGTITLGGSANGNGLMQVLNSTGGTVVRANNEGIIVTGGSIIVINNSGGTILDSAGLVGTTSFTYAQGSAGTTAQTITSTSFSNVTGGSVSLILNRTTNVLVNYSLTGYHIDFDGAIVARLVNGTTPFGPNIIWRGAYDAPLEETHSISFIHQFTSGTHQLIIQAKQNNVGGTAYIVATLTNTPAIINYLVLGN